MYKCGTADGNMVQYILKYGKEGKVVFHVLINLFFA